MPCVTRLYTCCDLVVLSVLSSPLGGTHTDTDTHRHRQTRTQTDTQTDRHTQTRTHRPFYEGGCVKQTTKYVNVSLETFKSVGIGEYS